MKLTNNQLTNSSINQQFVVLSCKSCRNHPLHLSRELYKSTFFMQNKAKLQNTKMNITAYRTKDSEDFRTFSRRKNKAKQSQNKPNFEPKLALFSSNEPNFKPNYVKIGNLKRKTLTGNADFFDEPQRKFRAVREETFEWLDLVESGPAVFIFFHTGTACIIIEFAVDIVKGVFATAARPVRVNRTQIIFQERTSAIV